MFPSRLSCNISSIPADMDLIVLIGIPAAGKSTFYRTNFASTHVLVSKDLLRNNRRPSRRQAQLISEALQAGHSVVVDNTNASSEQRAGLIALGRRYGATIIGYYFETQLKQSLERNSTRADKERVPNIAIFAMLKKMMPPTYEEGFDRLFCVHNNDDFTFNVSACAS